MGELKDWQAEEIKELRAEVDRLREALDTLHAVVGLTPILGNKEALQEAFDLAGKALKRGSDTPSVSYETPSVSEGG